MRVTIVAKDHPKMHFFIEKDSVREKMANHLIEAKSLQMGAIKLALHIASRKIPHIVGHGRFIVNIKGMWT